MYSAVEARLADLQASSQQPVEEDAQAASQSSFQRPVDKETNQKCLDFLEGSHGDFEEQKVGMRTPGG